MEYKPTGYNSVSPYFIVAGAQKLIDLLSEIFEVQLKRRFEGPDGKIVHAEIRVEDSILMLADANEKYPPVPMVLHVYVENVDLTFEKAISKGCEVVHPPRAQEGDPDRRGTFTDFAGNMWSVSTQTTNTS